MRVLVCGGRQWVRQDWTFFALDQALLVCKWPIEAIVHGATSDMRWGRSADWLAEDWAKSRGIPVDRFPVEHGIDGPWPAAGIRRNERMLRDGRIDQGIAFPGGNGTRHMVGVMQRKGIGVWLPYGK